MGMSAQPVGELGGRAPRLPLPFRDGNGTTPVDADDALPGVDRVSRPGPHTDAAERRGAGWFGRASVDAIWFSGRPWRPGSVIGHHDAAPYNAVWRDGRLVGFVDWDTAGPSSRAFDLAYAALLWVPLLSPGSSWPHSSAAPDDRARRLHLLLDACGLDRDRQSFGAVVAARARVNADVIGRLAAGGNPAYRAIRRQADDLERSAREIEALPTSFWQPPR